MAWNPSRSIPVCIYDLLVIQSGVHLWQPPHGRSPGRRQTVDGELMNETNNSQEIIICRDVHKWFDQFHVLKGISLTVQKGEVIVIFGPSGSGKSTFIRCLNRLEEHQKGQIIVDGIYLGNALRNVEMIRQEVGMVFQQFNLFPHLTVIQNITLAPSWVKRVP